MKIYADVLIIENFIVNLFLITLTMKAVKHRCSTLSLIVSSFIGGIYTVVLFIPQLKLLTSIPVVIIVAAVMLRISYGKINFFNMIKLLGVFIMLTFTLSGLCFVLSFRQNDYVIGRSFEISKYSIKYLLLGVMCVYIFIVRIIEYIKEKIFINNYKYLVEFSIGNKEYKIQSFLDTGNELKEPVTNLPCILVEEAIINDIVFDNKNTYYIPYNAIGYGGNLKGIRINKIKIKSNDFSCDEIDAIICPCKEKLSEENEFNALLSRGIV